MPERTVEVGSYSPQQGLRMAWTEGFVIVVTLSADQVVVRANREGLISLAQHLLTLAEDGVPAGAHIHLSPHDALEAGSGELVLERT